MRALLIICGLLIATSASATSLSYTIIPAEKSNPRGGFNPAWTPTRGQADAAFAALEADPSDRLLPLSEYDYQVLGKTAAAGSNMPGLEGGEARLIVLSGFCHRRLGPRLGREVNGEVIVFDGGNCFFRAYYDLVSRKVVWTSVNGHA